MPFGKSIHADKQRQLVFARLCEHHRQRVKLLWQRSPLPLRHFWSDLRWIEYFTNNRLDVQDNRIEACFPNLLHERINLLDRVDTFEVCGCINPKDTALEAIRPSEPLCDSITISRLIKGWRNDVRERHIRIWLYRRHHIEWRLCKCPRDKRNHHGNRTCDAVCKQQAFRLFMHRRWHRISLLSKQYMALR